MPFTDYHTTAASNTTLGGVSLQESQTKKKDVNNQIRAILAEVKAAVAWRVDDAAELQAVTFASGTISETVIVNTLGMFYYDSADTTTSDDAREVLVTTSGERYKLIRPLLQAYDVSQVPAATVKGGLIYVNDASNNRHLAFSDGTNWRFPDGAIVS